MLSPDGLCHCTAYSPGHVPVLAQHPGHSYPPCRDPSFRVLYIDDALIASVINVDRDCVPLLPTYGPHGRLGSCGLGVPGGWFHLQHRLRDVDVNARAVGIQLNTKKTMLMVFNFTHNRQFIPFCSLTEGEPLPVVKEMRLLGLLLDDRLSW